MENLDKAQELLQESYLIDFKIKELKEQISGLQEELSELNKQAYEALPEHHDPESLMLVKDSCFTGKAVIASWQDCENPGFVKFQFVHT